MNNKVKPEINFLNSSEHKGETTTKIKSTKNPDYMSRMPIPDHPKGSKSRKIRSH